MLNDPKLQQLMRDIVHGRLPAVQLEQVMTEPVIDSEGKDALRITLVLTSESVDAMTGDQALDLLSDIHKGLSAEGDERLPLVTYATQADLEAEENAEEVEQDEDEA